MLLSPVRYVLWVDPGVTTGWALYYVDEQVMHQEEHTFDRFVVRLDRWMATAGRHTVLGCERFVITSLTARRPGSVTALQVWGATRSAAVRHEAYAFLDHQNSSTALSFCPDEVLKALGWYRLGEPDANDAARHVFRWLAQNNLLTDKMRTVVLNLGLREGTRTVKQTGSDNDG